MIYFILFLNRGHNERKFHRLLLKKKYSYKKRYRKLKYNCLTDDFRKYWC